MICLIFYPAQARKRDVGVGESSMNAAVTLDLDADGVCGLYVCKAR